MNLVDGGKFFLVTPDGRLISDKENRYNPYTFSYTGPSGIIYTSPRKQDYPTGTICDRDIMNDRDKALIDEYTKPIRQIEEFNASWGYEFKIDREVIIPITDHNMWVEILRKHGLCYSTISIFEEKYKKKVKEKNHFFKTINKRNIRMDFLDPLRHLNIEHDGSAFHIPEEDEARDEYLHLIYTSLKIERISDFDNRKTEKIKELKNIFDKHLEGIQENPLRINFDSFVIDQQLKKFEPDLIEILKLIEKGYSLDRIGNKLATELNRYYANKKP